jgi:alginate O-acetyltransferase complex protein AlgI
MFAASWPAASAQLMLFNSEQYLLFLPCAVGLTWVMPSRLRPLLLLLASYYFYAAWNPRFLLLIIGLSAFNYAAGLRQGRQQPRSRALLAFTLIVDLGSLGVFKYLGLLDETAQTLATVLGLPAHLPLAQLILPLGLSFFTFEFVHYQVDLYRGSDPVADPIRFFLFPAFFPTQIAGPIKRYQEFDKQVRARPAFNATLFVEGCELISRGLFKKVVLADSVLLPFVTVVFAKPAEATFLDTWGMLLAFALQIYFDFSGYTDIGRGSAQLLGYTVPENFQAPYLATSLREFWHRWHISLSRWLRDYLYIPLGGSRKGSKRTQFNLIVTMALGGLWHGAGWHFMVWGLGHGIVLAVNRRWETSNRRRFDCPSLLSIGAAWVATQLTVMLLWCAFRAPDLSTLLMLWWKLLQVSVHFHLTSSLKLAEIVMVAAALLAVQAATNRWNVRERLNDRAVSVVLRPAFAIGLAAAAFLAGVGGATVHKFIYFQF